MVGAPFCIFETHQTAAMTFLWVFIGGGLGSVARYGISRLATSFYSGNFPLGTFISNMLACALLAILIAFVVPKQNDAVWLQPLLLIGFCGGFSTFSTFSNETIQLLQTGHTSVAVLNVLLSVAVGLGLIFWLRSAA